MQLTTLLATTSAAAAASATTTAPACGAPPSPLNASSPNALIIGDSISMGYGVNPTDTGFGYGLRVAALLGGPYARTFSFNSSIPAGAIATVQHAGGMGSNGGASANGAACVERWLDGLRWDVVTVNFGLHDADPGCDAATYSTNLKTVLSAARKAAGRVVFVTTTPFVAYNSYSMPCVLKLNVAARAVVASLNAEAAAGAGAALASTSTKNMTIEIADLYAAVESYCGAGYSKAAACPIQLAGNLHFR